MDDQAVRPSAVTFTGDRSSPPGCEKFLLRVAGYDPQDHGKVVELVGSRLAVEIRYESLYGGENYQVMPG